MKEVMMLAGAYQIGMMIARRTGYGKKIVIGDGRPGYAQAAAKVLEEEGFDAVGIDVDFSFRTSVLKFFVKAEEEGGISMLVGMAGIFDRSNAVRRTQKSCQHGMTMLLEETGRVIRKGGAGVFIAGQLDWKLAFSGEEEEQFAKKIMEEASRWEERQTRLNLISLENSIVLLEEKECSHTVEKIVDLAEFLLCGKDAFITGADFLIFG